MVKFILGNGKYIYYVFNPLVIKMGWIPFGFLYQIKASYSIVATSDINNCY